MTRASTQSLLSSFLHPPPQNPILSLTKPSLNPNPQTHNARPLFVQSKIEIRVCVNRSCNKLGSRETLQLLSNLAPPDVTVNSCGCLGRCGAGPNLVILPGAVFFSHCGTAAQAAELLASVSGEGFDPSKSLAALDLRRKGEGVLEKGNYEEAEVLLSKAIELKPCGGLHIIYKSRSAARLASGNFSGALEDAKEASRIAPSYPQAYLCRGDAFLAMDEVDAAEKAYSDALSLDPSIRRSKSFKARIAKVQDKLTTANLSS